MTRETKFGLLLVLILTSTFGVLVWKRLHQPKDLEANTASAAAAAEPAEGSNAVVDPFATNDAGNAATPLATVPATNASAPRRPAAAASKDVSTSTPSVDPFAATLEQPAATTTKPKPRMPINLDQQDIALPSKAAPTTNSPSTAKPISNTARTNLTEDPFVAEPPVAKVNPKKAATAVTTEDPFAFPADSSPNNSPAAAKPTPPAGRSAAPDSIERDPFSVETAQAQTPALAPAAKPGLSRAAAPAQEADPFSALPEDTPVEVSARSTTATTSAPIELPVQESPPVRTTSVPLSLGNPPATEVDPFAAEAVRLPSVSVGNDHSLPARTTPAGNVGIMPAEAELGVAAPLSDPRYGGYVPMKRVESRTPQTTVVAQPQSLDSDPFSIPGIGSSTTLPRKITGQSIQTMSAPLSGDTYIVQPNDNFWEISKKVYGTGKYFSALQRYNADVVSDPGRMKPGIKIATPPAEELKARFPQLLSLSGTDAAPVAEPAAIGLTGDSYLVQSGDNFWTISKRLYGDGKYFRALEQHNAALVADSSKLRPGLKIAAPQAAWLLARYPQLIASSAPAVEDLRRLQPERYQPDAVPGYFVGNDGQPMYRVGSEDTLTDIARNHLGRSSRWVQIYELNRDILKDGNALSIGAVLRLPSDASGVRVIGSDATGR